MFQNILKLFLAIVKLLPGVIQDEQIKIWTPNNPPPRPGTAPVSLCTVNKRCGWLIPYNFKHHYYTVDNGVTWICVETGIPSYSKQPGSTASRITAKWIWEYTIGEKWPKPAPGPDPDRTASLADKTFSEAAA